MAQTEKNPPAIQVTQVQPRFDPWVEEIPWRREWLPTPVLLPGEFYGQRSLVGYSPWGSKESDTTVRLHFTPNYGRVNEDNGDLLQRVPCMHCYECPQPCSRLPPTYASTGDSWTLPGKSGSVSCGVTAPFSWVLVHTRFCLCPPGVYFPVLCKFWQLYGGVNGDLLQEGLCHMQLCCSRAPTPAVVHC